MRHIKMSSVSSPNYNNFPHFIIKGTVFRKKLIKHNMRVLIFSITSFIIKPTRCTNFKNLFWHETLHVSDSSSVHHQEFIHCTLSNGMSYRFVDSFRAGPGWNCSSLLVLVESCLQTCMTYTIAEGTVNKLLMMDRRTVRNM